VEIKLLTKKGVTEMKNLTLLCFGIAALGALASPAGAEPYWISYEGTDYPENEGWRRMSFEPLADRCLDDGALVIDASQSGATNEWYEQYPVAVAPDEGELFIMQWRLNVEMFSSGTIGADVAVFSDDCWALSFYMSDDLIRCGLGTGGSANYEPGAYHEFEMRSFDMRSYELYLDGDLAFEGQFWESLMSNQVGWGKSASGIRSITCWDYFRCGVVPEPNTAMLLIGIVGGALGIQQRRR
jgi:hypothetical protein